MNGVPASKNGDLKYGLEEILDEHEEYTATGIHTGGTHEHAVLQTHRTVSPHGIFHASVRVFDLSRIA